MPKQAVILAAGGGGRSRPFTANRPNAMISVGGKPMIHHVIEALTRNGIKNIIVVVGHRKELIYDLLGTGESLGISIDYALQPKQLGSADALLQAQKCVDDTFLVLPGNKYLLPETLYSIINSRAPSVLVKTMADPPRSSIITTRGGRVENGAAQERRAAITTSPMIQKGSFTVDTRVYSLDKRVFPFLEGVPSIISALDSMIQSGVTLNAVETSGEWFDLIYPWDILPINEAILAHLAPSLSGTTGPYVYIHGNVNIGDSGEIAPYCFISGPVVIGRGCRIGPHASLKGPLSVGANTVIESFAYVANSVIGNDVHIGPGAIIEDSVIDDGTYIGARFTSVTGEADMHIGPDHFHQKVGCLIGEGCHMGAGTVAKPGTIVGNFCKVEDLKVLSGDIPDKSMVV